MAPESVRDLRLYVTQSDIDMLSNVIVIILECILMCIWIFVFYKLYISGVWRKSAYSKLLRSEYWESCFAHKIGNKRKKRE